MHNLYEIITIIDPNIPITNLKIHVNKYCNLIKKKNGKNIIIKIIQQKKLAWICKKSQYGYAIYHQYVAKPDIVQEYEENLKSTEICILWQTILIKKNIHFDTYIDVFIENKYSIAMDSEDQSFMKNIT